MTVEKEALAGSDLEPVEIGFLAGVAAVDGIARLERGGVGEVEQAKRIGAGGIVRAIDRQGIFADLEVEHVAPPKSRLSELPNARGDIVWPPGPVSFQLIAPVSVSESK